MKRWALRSVTALAVAGWMSFAFTTWYSLAVEPTRATGDVFQVDWHVYSAGARDLVDRTLYRVPLDAGGLRLSSPEFNLPPFAAAWALPLLVLPEHVAGYIWQLIAAASISVAAVVLFDLAGVSRPLLHAGLVLGPLALTLLYLEGLHLATNNYLVLAMVALGLRAYIRQHDRAAGTLVGIAIATKLWPVTLLILAAGDRRVRVCRWAAGVLALQGIVFLAWLGVDVIGPMARALRVEIPATGFLIGPSAVPGLRTIWIGGLGFLVMVAALLLLVLVPPHGRTTRAGVAVLAGMAPIANLWIHYAPTILFGLGLLGIHVGGRYKEQSVRDTESAIAEHPQA